ncbi:MAG: hypothetical protein KDD48_02450 [Bdellovibrionales bacterium]|nr:hypothetical protein [Bdellovibrionales bacterium]
MGQRLSKQKLLLDLLQVSANDPQSLQTFLSALFTSSEIKDIQDRIRILISLHQGNSQRTVSQSEKVSISKVTRGAATLRKHRKFFTDLFRRLC